MPHVILSVKNLILVGSLICYFVSINLVQFSSQTKLTQNLNFYGNVTITCLTRLKLFKFIFYIKFYLNFVSNIYISIISRQRSQFV